MARLSDGELEQIRRRDELIEPVRFRTQAEQDRRVLLSEVTSLRAQLRGIRGEQRQEWERRRWERDNEIEARRVSRMVDDIEDDAGAF